MGLFSFIGGILGGGAQKKASQQAMEAQTAAYNRGIDLQQQQYQQTRADYQPYTQAGNAAIGDISALLGLPTGATMSGYGGGTFDLNGQQVPDIQERAIEALKQRPLYQSLYNNGREALLQNGSATGGLRGGNFERASMDFGSDVLAQVYQQQLANLNGVAGLGLGATGSVANAGLANANAQTALNSEIGGAQAANFLTKGGINAKNWANAGSFLDSIGNAGVGSGGFSLSKALSAIF